MARNKMGHNPEPLGRAGEDETGREALQGTTRRQSYSGYFRTDSI